MKKRLLTLFLGIFFAALQAAAQQKTVTGKVTDDDALPLPGVSVRIKGTTTGTQTGTDGSYSIKVNPGQVLVFSFLGTVSQERIVGEESIINLSLKNDAKALKEVVITGFGQAANKRDLTYSVQGVKGNDIAGTQRENFLTALQGRVAGATVTSTSGQPGASASIILRGINSIAGNNQPLFIIDGVRISNTTFAQSGLQSDGPNRNADYNNRASDINPDDIENVTVLKGPEAAAIYGSDATSGAIVITTKKGRSGGGSIDYDNSFSLSNAYNYPETQRVYGRGLNGAYNPATRTGFGPKYPEGTKFYDNVNNFLKTGVTQSHNISFDGGSDKATYRVSGEYRKTEGVMPVAYNDRISARFSGSANISPKFTSSAAFNYFNTTTRKLNKGNTGTYINLLTWPADDDIQNYLNPDETRRRVNTVNSVSDALIDFDNPNYDANFNISKDRTNRMLSNVDLSYDPLSWLNFRGLIGVDFYTTQGNNLINPGSSSYQNSPLNGFNATSGIAARGILENYTDNSLLTNGSFFVTAKKEFKDFRSTLALGGEAFDNRDDINTIYGEKFYDLSFNSINNVDPTTQRAKNTITEQRRFAAIGRFNATWKDMVTLQITGRNDWSSTLIADRSYFYPSVGAGFEFTQLDVLKGNKILSYGKLRASYAQVGKDAPVYRTGSALDLQTSTGGGYQLNVTKGNPELKPERTKSYEFGGEFKFLDNRLGADIAYYGTRSTNQIFNPRLSYGTGFVIEFLNGGTILNKGIEVQLTGTPIRNKNFTWDAYLNFDKAKGKVIDLAGFPEYYNSDTWLYANARASIFPGGSTTAIASYDYTRNTSGQILINPDNGLPISNGIFVQTGDRQPDFKIGFGSSFTMKGISLSFLFDIRKGGDVFNGNELFLTRIGLSNRTLNRETPVIIPGVLKDGNENSANPVINTIQVTPATRSDYYTSTIESDFIEHNINYIKLRDVTLSYRLPATLLNKQKVIKNASVFMTGTELFTITNYSGGDPDVNGTNASTAGSGAAGFDFGSLPTPRTLSFGIKFGL